MKVEELPIGKRLGLGFAAILVFAIVITGISIIRLQAVATATQVMMTGPLVKERLISDLNRFVFASVRRTTAIVKSSDPTLGPFFIQDAAATLKGAHERLSQFRELATSEQENALLKQLDDVTLGYRAARENINKAKADGNHVLANELFENQFLPSAKSYEQIVQSLLDHQRSTIDETATTISNISIDSRNLLILLTVLVTALGVWCAWWLTHGITKPLKMAVAFARRVANGEISAAAPSRRPASKDEASQLLYALDEMNANLYNIVYGVRQGVETIANASSEIAAGNYDLSSRTEHQAASLEATASSMEQLTATVKQNAEGAVEASSLATSASTIAVKGGELVRHVVHTMDDIKDSSQKIVNIISVIDGIAFQTNILALNAAVEAARAGEQGRGFAVVASEVRVLAHRSSNAAREIKSLIQESVEKVNSGSKLVTDAGKTMEDIVTSVGQVTSKLQAITEASREQSSGIEQINQVVTQMDEFTQQNAALVEEAAAASKALHDQVSMLSKTVSKFKVHDATREVVS